MKRQCRFRKTGGGICLANATASSGLCFFHDPDRAAVRRAAQSAGGLRNKAVSLPTDTPDCDLKNVADIIALLGTTINEVRRGQIDPRVSNAVGYLASALLKALELGNLEQRLSDLESAVRHQSFEGSIFDGEKVEFVPDSGRVE
jgi:hypothetical protein